LTFGERLLNCLEQYLHFKSIGLSLVLDIFDILDILDFGSVIIYICFFLL
jgi:hypothetical protein